MSSEEKQELLHTLYLQQEANSKKDLTRHHPSVFISFNHRRNLFYQSKTVDESDKSILRGESDSISILSLSDDLRDEVCFFIKKDLKGQYFIKTGDYNKDASDAFVSVLRDAVEGKGTIPFIIDSSVPLSRLGHYKSGRNVCEAFLQIKNLKESRLKLKVVDEDYDEDGSALLVDAKNHTRYYLLSDNILYAAEGKLERNKVILFSLKKIEEKSLRHEIVNTYWVNNIETQESIGMKKYTFMESTG